PATDPGYTPMRVGLAAGHPGLSSVMDVGSIPVVAMAVPVTANGATGGVLVGYFRADHSSLETYLQRIRFGRSGRSYLIDASGMVVAASNPDDVGRHMPASPAVSALGRTATGVVEYGSGTNRLLASFAPLGVEGWGSLTTERSAEFFGPIRRGHDRI